MFVSSVAGFVTAPLYGMYSASKHALEAVSDALRREVSAFDMSVSVVQPAYVATAIKSKLTFQESSLVALTGLRPDVSPDQVTSTYPHLFTEKARKAKELELKAASSTAVTDEAIAHAITCEFPKTRYRVASAGGMPAEMLSWVMWALTDRAKDFVVKRKG